MKGFLIIALLLLAGQAHSMTGSDILAKCAPIFDSSGPSDVEEATLGMHCLGYIEGLDDMAIFAAERYCVPDPGIETGQMIRVFLKVLEENPELLRERASITFLAAMRQAFPCPA